METVKKIVKYSLVLTHFYSDYKQGSSTDSYTSATSNLSLISNTIPPSPRTSNV